MKRLFRFLSQTIREFWGLNLQNSTYQPKLIRVSPRISNYSEENHLVTPSKIIKIKQRLSPVAAFPNDTLFASQGETVVLNQQKIKIRPRTNQNPGLSITIQFPNALNNSSDADTLIKLLLKMAGGNENANIHINN